jgi:hypothetical protein
MWGTRINTEAGYEAIRLIGYDAGDYISNRGVLIGKWSCDTNLEVPDIVRTSNWSGSSTTSLNTALSTIGTIVEGSSSGMSTAVAPSKPKSVMKLTLPKGVWVIDGNCEFPQHNTGRRVLLISSAENALNGDDESRIVIDAVQGSVTRPHTSTIRNVSLESQTFYLNAWQNSGSELAVTPNMRAVRIR